MALTPLAMQRLMLGVILFCLPACGAGGVHQMKNGNLRVQCPAIQSECMQKAELHCKDHGGVHVLRTREKNELYGVEGNMEGTLLSEVVFVCGDDAPRKPIKLPPKPDAAPRKPAADPAKRICVPGSTQRCVGPAACVGGQSCLPAGTGWGACKCAPATTEPAPEGAAATGGADAAEAEPSEAAEAEKADTSEAATEPAEATPEAPTKRGDSGTAAP